MREPFHPDTDDIELASILHALSDPVRLEIVARLAATGAEPCGDINDDIALHKSTLSHHYRVLREAGVTRTTIEGRARVVGLRGDDLDRRFPHLLDTVIRAAGGTTSPPPAAR
jgi:DNA-binding transcriptional ArsR family regulator